MMMIFLEVLKFLSTAHVSPTRSQSYRQSRSLMEIPTPEPLKFGIDLQTYEGSMLPYLLSLILATS